MEVLSGGVAEELGLRVGDVIISVNGHSVVTPRGSPDDPVDVFVRKLLQLDCGDAVTLEYMRDGSSDLVEFTVSTQD